MAWGGKDFDQSPVPDGLSGVVAIAAGGYPLPTVHGEFGFDFSQWQARGDNQLGKYRSQFEIAVSKRDLCELNIHRKFC